MPSCWIARRTTSTSSSAWKRPKATTTSSSTPRTPSLKNDCKVAEAIKQNRPETKIGFVGAHAAVLPTETLKASPAIDWVGRKEFDFTCKEVAEGRPLETIAGLSYRDKEGKIKHNPEREMIQDMDSLPWVADVYKRDLQIEKYFIGYLLHPYVSLYTGRGCPAQCTFCLWPQTIGGHKYRVRSPQNVADEMAYMKKLFPQVKEFFFDDDTFTANLPRAREIAKKLAPLGLTWSCNSRANLDYDTIKSFKDSGLRLFLVGYESGNEQILKNIKKGVTLDEMRRFTKSCHQAGVVIHGTFILGLPVETRETIEETIRFAQELDVFSMQVSLAAPYPGTELYEMARQNGWFAKTGQDRPGGRRRLPAKRPRISRPEQGRDLRSRGPLLPRLLSAPQADPPHHQDHAGGQGRLRAPLPRGLRVLQEPPAAQGRSGGVEERLSRGSSSGLRFLGRMGERDSARPAGLVLLIAFLSPWLIPRFGQNARARHPSFRDPSDAQATRGWVNGLPPAQKRAS